MSRNATVSSLRAIKHSSSAWAGFAPMLTVTLTVAKTKLCVRIFRPALMGDSHSTTRSLANALHCGAVVTDLRVHVILSAKPRPPTARVPALLCSLSKTFGADVQIRANVIVALHDALQRFVESSVQRKCSAPTVMTFPQRSSYVFSLPALSEVDLGDVSKPETM